ncbi:Fur family transcriptional regulator [Compostibacter hankyongensis]|uniref:Transcriptional repressor n=1 Tax=Compostibacter hankyongensis TaxID=1007089 RepID=A0ABP8FHH1_9BACT
MTVTALEEKLMDKRVAPTAMRLLVLDFLLQQETAVSLADLEKNMAHSDRVTLYRTLKTFEEKGLAHRIEDGTGTVKYALCDKSCDAGRHHDLHVHFYCSCCRETFCLPRSGIPAVKLPPGFREEEISLTVKGICAKCTQG